MPLVEQELHTLPEYLSHHHDECKEVDAFEEL
jgi:hypothetical protein